MKKLVAISVLFAGLATAVFAQSGGWSNEWKVGLSAMFITDMFYAAKVTGKTEETQETTITPPIWGLTKTDGTTTKEIGKYDKGVTSFFPNSRSLPGKPGGDYRLMLSLENSGENYSMWANIAMDDSPGEPWNVNKKWLNKDDFSVWKFFSEGRLLDDFGFHGTAGIFAADVGSKSAPGGWVDTNATWGSWIAWSELNRFGIWRYIKRNGDSGSVGGVNYHSDNFRSQNQWGNVFAVSITPVDNFRFALGYRFDAFDSWWNPNDIDTGAKTDSRSNINGTFMLSGRPADVITFDVFYSVIGQDGNTFSRPADKFGYNDPEGKGWSNLIGAYVGINGIENLALSVGYTVHFNAYEGGGFLCDDGDYAQSKAVTYNSPIYSGIDLRLGYSGIDKIGLKFNNNLSFAGVKGDKVGTDANRNHVYKDTINLLLNENFNDARTIGEGLSQDWLHWQSVLQANLGFIDGVGLEVTLGNNLGVLTEKIDKTVPDVSVVAPNSSTDKTDSTSTKTNNEFRATVGATYGVGNVKLGIALFLSWVNDTTVSEGTYTNIYTTPAGTTTTVFKRTFKDSKDTVKFGIPIYFKVSF